MAELQYQLNSHLIKLFMWILIGEEWGHKTWNEDIAPDPAETDNLELLSHFELPLSAVSSCSWLYEQRCLDGSNGCYAWDQQYDQ